MKNMTERDKTLAMILPALVILVIYAFYPASFPLGRYLLRGKLAELSYREKARDDAKAKLPNPGETITKRNEAMKLTAEMQTIQTKLAYVQKQWRDDTAFCAPGTQRHDRVEKLTALLNKHHLTSMEDAEADAGTKETKASPALESMMQKIAQLSNAQQPQLRRIRFHGRFVDVHDALDELAKGPVLAIPVGLTMKTTNHPDLREWTLLVWL